MLNLLCLLTILALAGPPQNGPYKEMFTNGKVRGQGNYKKGKMEGTWEWFYDDGKPMCKLGYKKGKRHGNMTCWYKNNQVSMSGLYENGFLMSSGAFDEKGMPGIPGVSRDPLYSLIP